MTFGVSSSGDETQFVLYQNEFDLVAYKLRKLDAFKIEILFTDSIEKKGIDGNEVG